MLTGVLFALAAGLVWGLVFVAPLMLPDYPAALLSCGRYVAFGLIALPLGWLDRRNLAGFVVGIFDLPLLLAHNAELLDALQYIARRAFSEAVAAGVQIDFDAGGYRHARRQELELMAVKAAERVKVSRVPFVFDPMNAQDRRIIHTVLVDIEGIRTESEGEGQMRRVKVLPG